VIYSGKYDFDLAQRKYEKRQKAKPKSDLTLEVENTSIKS
jgi:hypothetical protein